MNIISYDINSGTLVVEFPGDLANDRIHEFYEIPVHVFHSLRDSSNPQAYFNENIWGNKYEKRVHWSDLSSLMKYIEENMCFKPPVSVNSCDYDGDTPLHVATVWGDTGAVELLIENGADVNAKGDMGCTPLYNAISFGHARCVEILLSKGANINDSNELGSSSLERAKTEGNERIGAIIEKFV
tara:strand:+ start:592 stop:1143 length:552 start_codon:yes stop_codon:yes gene_type:complete